MFDFRLKVFFIVAQRLNFTKAAEELFISQPAVSKHVKEIEKHYQCALFERNGNTLKLTAKGEMLKKYAARILALYQEMDSEIHFLNEKHHGLIHIGASTTASQYVLPGFLASFKKNYPHIALEVKTDNTEKIENLLLNNTIDIGVVEGKSRRNSLEYTPFKKDELVLCTKASTLSKPVLEISELRGLPFIIREKGSGTLEIIRSALLKNNLKLDELHVEMTLENNESIKSYLQHSNAFAFISISAIIEELKNNKLKIIDVEGLTIERYYYVVIRQETQNQTTLLLKNTLIDNQKL